MSKQLYTVSKEGLEYLCGLINKIVSTPSELISDITLATNQTMSSVKIDKIIKQCLQDANEYSNEVVNSLTHLVAEKIDFEPTLDNTTDKINTLLLYSANSDNNYTQYLRLTNELLNLGDTSLSLNEYMKEVDADAKYTLKTTTDTLSTEVTNIKTDFNTHKDDTDIHTSADEKASYVKKTDIATTINSSSTDDEVPSAKSVYNEMLKFGSNPNVYTLGEQVVGKWIDGKPIYRKVVNNIVYDGGDLSVNTGISNISTLIKLEFIEDGVTASIFTNYKYIGTNRRNASIRIDKYTGVVSTEGRNTSVTGDKGILIIEYTKTTD